MNKRPSPLNTAAARPSRAAAAAGVLRRTVLLALLACVVASFGLTAGTRAEADRPRTFSEQALNEAFATARVLAADATGLAVPAPAAAEMKLQAQTLTEQALLLSGPGGTARQAGAPADAGSSGESPVTYVQALQAAARTNLEAAGRADYGTARLLASVGAGQLLLAQRAADVLGENSEPLQESGWTPVLEESAARCTNSDAASDRTQLRDRPGAAESLRAVLDAEFGAVYAYEVAQAQGGRSIAVLGQTAAEHRAAHLKAGEDGVRHLSSLCLPAVSPLPAYSLTADFFADPAGSLSAMEAALPGIYADLAGSSDGALRSWAIDRLVQTSLAAYSDSRLPPASPGITADPASLPWAAG
ncbi:MULTISPECIES: DUF4439 domain-containing protein [Arthrobacter]|uniref:DUF4439 domain-containing protein n=1 Tax=Arthrobacter TaxID=1663 RepID=UPI001D15270A|nr:ferritin-like domain-containing protein [Arthrobacter caoxuetaonis]MCC9193962.1 ferritin-like domain-containing protein [Arthrobacter sp. zg-Y916]